jgi:hypothetical protein
MVSTLDVLGTAGLHDLDEATNERNEIPGGASGPIERAVLAMAATNWPDELSAQADELQTTLEELVAAVGEEDAAAAAPAAAAAHDAQHDFEHEVRNMIASAVGLPVEEEEAAAGATQ